MVSDAQTRFRRHIEAKLVDAMSNVPGDDRSQLYIVALWLAPEQLDERRVTATLGWNTTTHLRAKAAARGPRAIFEWSISEFAQPEAASIANAMADPQGAELRRAWLESEGLWYPDERADLAVDEEDPEIWARFLALIVEIVQQWHAGGDLHATVGHRVPVFIDRPDDDEEDEYELRDINRAANPESVRSLVDRWSTKPLGPVRFDLLEQQ